MQGSTFLKNLKSSRLVQSDTLSWLRVESDKSGVDAKTLAIHLVQHNKLTAYHARQLLAGRSDGFLLGKYKILEPLGEGGMGQVFKAEDTEQHRVVAIKLLPEAKSADPQALERFHREASLAQRLHHENVVSTYEAGCHQRTHFIVMEFVPGQNLGKLVSKKGRLTPTEAASIIHQISLGLEHALDNGVIHRDIKPSNIMVMPDGKAKITDMGLARHFSPTEAGETTDTLSASLTETGDFLGTVDFIAPEQALDSHTADTRSDIYSLGCTMYRCLTGAVPFPKGSVVQKLLLQQQAEPKAIEELAPDVPEGLRAVVRRMMAKRPADRYQRPGEVAQALARFLPPPRPTPVAKPERTQSTATAELSPQEVLEAIANAAEQVPPWMRERDKPLWKRVGTYAIGGAILLFALLMYWSTTRSGTLAIEIPRPDTAGVPSPKSPSAVQPRLVIDGELQSLDGDETTELRLRSGSHTLVIQWPGYEPVNRTMNINSGETARIKLTPTAETRDRWEWEPFVRRVDAAERDEPAGSTVVSLKTELLNYARQNRGTAKASRAYDLMARLRWPADLLRHDSIPDRNMVGEASKSRESIVAIVGESRLRHWNGVTAVAFSHDGKTLATASKDCTVTLWDKTTGDEVLTLNGHTASVSAVAFNPDDSVIASASADKTVKLWSATDGKFQRTMQLPTAVSGVAFSPDGQRLAAVCVNLVLLWTLPADDPQPLGLQHAGAASVVFSSDGKTVITASRDGSIKFWDVANGEERRSLDGTADRITALGLSSSGQMMAVSIGGAIRVRDLTTGENRSELRHAAASTLAFSPNGEMLASGSRDGTIKLWNVATGQEQHTLRAHRGAVTCLGFSQDGQTLASGDDNHSVKLWDVATGQELSPAATGTGPIKIVAFSPDGQLLAAGSEGGAIQLWDIATGRVRSTLEGHTKPVNSVEFSANGRLLISASEDKTVRFWNVQTGKEQRKLDAWGRSLTISPDGQFVVLATQTGPPKYWKLATGEELRDHKGLNAIDGTTAQVAFAPDGKMLAAASGAVVKVYDAATGREFFKLTKHKQPVTAIAFRPDGQRLATAARERALQTWNPITGKESVSFDDHTGPILSLAYSADGRILASAAEDGTVRLWNTYLDSGAPFRRGAFTLAGGGGIIRQVAFSPEGRHIATVNGDGTVYILRLPPARTLLGKPPEAPER